MKAKRNKLQSKMIIVIALMLTLVTASFAQGP
jgi:hypothetical protein